MYDRYLRYKLDPLRSPIWKPYADFIFSHNVLAVSLHPPQKGYCTQKELEIALIKMRKVLQVPVYLEVMPADEYWCSSLETLIDFPLLLNVSHINIWHHGDRNIVQDTCLNLLNSFAVETIHSSHNRGNADTHDLIPDNIWFKDYIEIWSDRYLVTYESQPVKYAAYERLDKCRKGMATLC